MSTYKPNAPMPVHLIELRNRVKQCSGLHMSFPYGTRLPKPGENIFSTDLKRHMQFVGLTIRGFFYAGKVSIPTSVFELFVSDAIRNFFAAVNIEKRDVKFHFAGYYAWDAGKKFNDISIRVPGYYSVAVRIKDARHLSTFFNDEELGQIDQYSTINWDWQFRMKGGVHFLLSLHISAETYTAPKILGQSFFLQLPEFGIGSYWLIECSVEDPSQPVTVFVKVDHTQFPFREVKKGDVVTIQIRSTIGGFVLSKSFDDRTNFISTSENAKNVIYPSISKNCQILRQYTAQGAERWQ